MELSSLCEHIDDSFGPHAGTCRGGFDFTLMFEETILSILPLVILFLVVPLRTGYLIRRGVKVNWSRLLPFKLVCMIVFDFPFSISLYVTI